MRVSSSVAPSVGSPLRDELAAIRRSRPVVGEVAVMIGSARRYFPETELTQRDALISQLADVDPDRQANEADMRAVLGGHGIPDPIGRLVAGYADAPPRQYHPGLHIAGAFFARVPLVGMTALAAGTIGVEVAVTAVTVNTALRLVSHGAAIVANPPDSNRLTAVTILAPAGAALLSAAAAAPFGAPLFVAACVGHEVCETLLGVANLLESGAAAIAADYLCQGG